METIEAIMESTIQYSPIEMVQETTPTLENESAESNQQWGTIAISILGSLITGGLIYWIIATQYKNGKLFNPPLLPNNSENIQQ